jgi:hypothetical protein
VRCAYICLHIIENSKSLGSLSRHLTFCGFSPARFGGKSLKKGTRRANNPGVSCKFGVKKPEDRLKLKLSHFINSI